ncbi:hypothetical protein GGX14DRAFT_413977 [Mycena pura]|uniref:Rpr2-domain-containing protein n=1 Tax=Mycena pura TaxID=153505 RepID=A0AAD6YT54_9AGAR|nr:hypothetical protein GGX14DRAFT_413977 [Mycena pura]
MESTAKFQQALPYALLPVSPSLSALHFARVAPGASPVACHQCGCAFHRGESSVRIVRTASKASPGRTIQTTCLVCGWVQALPISHGNAALFPRTRKGGARKLESTSSVAAGKQPTLAHQEATFLRPTTPPTTMQTIAPNLPEVGTSEKRRPKKKGGLQSMLERNRERESKEKQSKTGPGGLAMFLSTL